jgi:hypothetical protein
MKMLAHHQSNIGNKVIPIFQQAINEDPELGIQARQQIPAAIYMMDEATVSFDTWLSNIL